LIDPYIQIPCRRFGRTEIRMPVLSLGGMRFQQSWKDLSLEEIDVNNQFLLEQILKRAASHGLHHIETARHYGSSEMQLGIALKGINDPKRIIQTKVPPKDDPKQFEEDLELSFQKLGCEKVDLLSIHGINLPSHLHQTLRPGGCLEVVRRWQLKGRISYIGFSTHAPTDLIVEAIKSNAFDYVNLHWYFIRQDNERALAAAEEFDLGVFIISPTDKGGHLHTPSSEILGLSKPLHPIVFNDLFCLSDQRVHTISVGMSSPEDLDLHLEAVNMLHQAEDYLPSIKKKFADAAVLSLGEKWLTTWEVGLPTWNNTPGKINIPTLLWLYNLLEAWGMYDYAKARYGLLGKAGHWFPGENADLLDSKVSELELRGVLTHSPWINEIPRILRKLKMQLGGETKRRLWSS